MTRRPINSLCDTCREPLLWAVTIHGRWLPLDSQANPAGNVILDRSRQHLGAVVLGPADALAVRIANPQLLYQTHFASHPECARLRVRKRQCSGKTRKRTRYR